jgi:RNA polymerase sigma factor (sigma-70 family)
MTDDRGDVGAADPHQQLAPSPYQTSPATEPTPDQAASAAEFALFYTDDFHLLTRFLIVQGAGHLAADIAQETMIKAYRLWDLLDRPGAWVRIVAQRHWWKIADRNRAEAAHSDLPEPAGLLSQTAYEQIEGRHAFLALLDDLPELQRQVLAWSYDGYHPTEIAVALNKNPATVRSALREARARVQPRYQANGGQP